MPTVTVFTTGTKALRPATVSYPAWGQRRTALSVCLEQAACTCYGAALDTQGNPGVTTKVQVSWAENLPTLSPRLQAQAHTAFLEGMGAGCNGGTYLSIVRYHLYLARKVLE